MGLTPVTGLGIINNFLRLFRARIPVDTRGIRFITKRILARSLNLYFDKLRKEDELMSFE